MKLLFIGEGRHDIGDLNPNPFQPRLARGTIPTLARQICSSIVLESVALAWSEIRRFNPSAQKNGFSAKFTAAVLVAVRKFNCEGTVAVTDRDGCEDRQSKLEEGVKMLRSWPPITRPSGDWRSNRLKPGRWERRTPLPRNLE